MLVSQITRRQHFQCFYQLYHWIIVLLARDPKIRKRRITVLQRFFWTIINMRQPRYFNISLSLQRAFSEVTYSPEARKKLSCFECRRVTTTSTAVGYNELDIYIQEILQSLGSYRRKLPSLSYFAKNKWIHLNQGFSTLALLILWGRSFFVVGLSCALWNVKPTRCQ